jgi:hypothetical protein
LNGTLKPKALSTCPVIPKYHASFGEPMEKMKLNMEKEKELNGHKHSKVKDSVKMMNRIDKAVFTDKNEVYMKDDFGIYIIYDCVFEDMKTLEDEILRIGSFYI